MSANITAIIPARGGSKGIPHKNIVDLNGKPLIAYTIEAAKNCPLITHVVVSSEEPEIKKIAHDFGAEVISRPDELATDNAPVYDVVIHALGHVAKPDLVVLLQSTSPLRTATHIEECLSQFIASGKFACAISVAAENHHPLKSFTMKNGELVPFGDEKNLAAPRQNLPPVYRQNGAIYVIPSDRLIEKPGFFRAPAMPFVMREEDSVDIDTPSDLKLAEFYLKNR